MIYLNYYRLVAVPILLQLVQWMSQSIGWAVHLVVVQLYGGLPLVVKLPKLKQKTAEYVVFHIPMTVLLP